VIRFPLYSSPGYSIAFTRFLRAELLALNGRSEEALSWFRAFKGIYVYDIPFRAPAALRMAEIYEKSGRRREAIAEYRKFLYLWRDCDKMFAPIVTEAQKHLAALERI
jgi:tetratricopeptide (TPR) repeat protein